VNRKISISIVSFILVCLAAGFLTSCSSSNNNSNTPATVTPSTQSESATVGGTFAPLSVTVANSSGTPLSGVSVTFTVNVGTSGATASFATGGTTDTETTNSSGVAQTSQTLTAGTVAGAFTVAATAGSVSGSFNLSNTAGTPATLAVSSGSNQSAAINAAFANPLVANVVDADNNPVQGVQVTFTAPASGASGTFASNSSATEMDTTDANGNATSSTFTANGTTGGPYNVIASASGLTSVNFAETNTLAAVTSATYVFYASGLEEINGGPNYYSVAGAITIDANGNVLAGEEDYSDAYGVTSPGDPTTPDTLSVAVAGTPGLVVDPTTGIGTLTVLSSYTSVGPTTNPGVETFAVQFVNANHALITQFDGSATSSGSLDLQTATSASSTAPNFSFAITGVDNGYNSIAYGGVFTINSTGATGTIDVNDNGNPITGTSFTVTNGTPDSYGRTVLTGLTNPVTSTAFTLAAYPVGPEVFRLIDVDAPNSVIGYPAGVGSAYGQGSATTFTTASLGSSVFTNLGQWDQQYATLGQFTTDGNGNITGGIADDNEMDNDVQQEGSSITGTYSLSSTNGYGSISISGDGDFTASNPAGLYMVDPTLNINDPNNTTTDLGGALIVDMDTDLPGGMGVITPQTDTTATDFTNNTNPYVAGFQNFNEFGSCGYCELDMVGPFTMTSGLFATAAIGAEDSDPFGTWDGTPAESAGDTYSSTPLSVSAGYFSMSQGNPTANPLDAVINTNSGIFDADIYQASATTLYWLEFDDNGVFLGPIEQQGSLTGVPGFKKAGAKARPQQKGQVNTSRGGKLY
jgi:hypothetical protein